MTILRTTPIAMTALALLSPATSPARSDERRVYSEDGVPDGATLYTWGPGVAVQEVEACDTLEGVRLQRAAATSWGGWGVSYSSQQDFSEFHGGAVRFWVRSPVDLEVELTCSSNVHRTQYISGHGWDHTNRRQEIQIPVCDVFSPSPCDLNCLGRVEYAFSVTAEATATFSVDYVRWYKAPARPGRSTVLVSGRGLFLDGRPFAVRGVDYSPTPAEKDYRYDWSAHPERYSSDLARMHALGINAIRTYRPLTRSAALDAAYAQGLYVIQQLTVDPLKLSCPEGKQRLKDRFAEMEAEWKDHQAILMWLVGKEVNATLQAAGWPAWYQAARPLRRPSACSTRTGLRISVRWQRSRRSAAFMPRRKWADEVVAWVRPRFRGRLYPPNDRA